MAIRSKGMTLIETLVTCGLFWIAVIGVFGLFDYLVRVYHHSDARSDSQRQAIQLIARFQRDRSNAAWASVALTYPSGNPNQGDLALSWLTDISPTTNLPVCENNTYEPIYQENLVYYLDSPSQTVRRVEVPLTNPTMDVKALNSADLLAALSLPNFAVQAVQISSWQALDFASGLPIQVPQNPSRYVITAQTNDNLPIQLEFRSRFLN